MSRCFRPWVGAGLILSLAGPLAGAPFFGKLPTASAEEYRPLPYIIESWQTENGLPQNYVTSIAQTPEGYLWIGTYNGLARFDGVRFVTYDPDKTPELKHSHVHRVLTDTHGTLWISTSGGGLTTWRDGQFRLEWRGSAVEGGVRRLLSSRTNEVLFGLSSGQLLHGVITAAGTNRWEVIAAGQEVTDYHADREGNVLGRTPDERLVQLVGDKFEPLLSDVGLAGKRISVMLTDNAGRLWVGTEKEIALWEPDQNLRSSRGDEAQSQSEKLFPGSTGDPPVPSGDSPDGTAETVRANGDGFFTRWLSTVPVGGSPTGAGESPALPIFQTGSQTSITSHASRLTEGQSLVTSAATGRFRNMTPTNGEAELSVTGMLATSEGSLWVTANGGTRRCRDRQWVAEAPDWRPEPSARTVGYYGDREGGMWVHFGTGLLHVRPDGQVRRITTEHGLANDRVACWFQDREHNIWVGLNRGGLVRLRPRHFQVLGLPEGLSDQVAMSVCEDNQGAMWIGTYGGGLNRWVNGVFTHFNLGLSNTPGVVVAVCPDLLGRVWIGTAGNGVLVRQQEKFKRLFSSESMDDRAYAIFPDRSGRMWMGNRRGLFCWADGELKQFGAADGVRSTDFRAFAEDAVGAVWIGATDGPVYRFADGKFTRFRATDALANQPVYSLLADDDGTLWIGTFRGGLLRFKDEKFIRYTSREGLPNNVICHILDGGRGQLWMSSHQGIFRVAKQALHGFARGENHSVPCVAYGKFDGLSTLECSGNYQPTGWRSRDGRLWFATVKGVVSVQPDEVTVNPLPPPVVIEEVLVDGEVEPLKRLSVQAFERSSVEPRPPDASAHASTLQRFNASTGLRIGPGRRHIEFRFTGLSLSAPDKVQFQYLLEGLDRNWIDGGTKRTTSYSYVPAGSYRFCVRACNNDGVWNETGASLALVVLPHFWQTWWFIGMAALTAFGTVGGAIRYVEKRKLQRRLERLERERAIERERARIAQDIHDDLGASLTRITLLSESARDARNGNDPAAREMDQIYCTARELTRAMDEIVWAVNPQHDTLDSLATYLGKFAQDLLRAAGVRCRLDMPVHLPPLPLTSEVRHNLFLAFKEALHNAVKHAGAKEVRFQLTVQPEEFTLSVEDDGKGLASTVTSSSPVGSVASTSRIASGHGLRNMRKRLEEIGGRCQLESRAEAGTRVKFAVPMKAQKD